MDLPLVMAELFSLAPNYKDIFMVSIANPIVAIVLDPFLLEQDLSSYETTAISLLSSNEEAR